MFIFEHNISDSKRLDISLLNCLGFGLSSSKLLFSKFGFNLNNSKMNKLNKKFFKKFESRISRRAVFLLNFCVGAARKNKTTFELKKVRESFTFRSLRHNQRLPTRGQRTRTNAKTQKSKRGARKNLPIAAKKKI